MNSYKINVHYIFTIRKQQDALISLLNENHELLLRELDFCFNNSKITDEKKKKIKIYDYNFIKKLLKKEKINFTFIKFENYKDDFMQISKILENKFKLKTHKKKIKISKTNYSIQNKIKRRGTLYKIFIKFNEILHFIKLKNFLEKLPLTKYFIEFGLYKSLNKKYQINKNLKFKY